MTDLSDTMAPSTCTNTAAFLPCKQHPAFNIGPAPLYTPGHNEILIRVHAVAVNPADVGIQKYGILLNAYPAILGCDAAGEIISSGPISPPLPFDPTPGIRVFGATTPLQTKQQSDTDTTIYPFASFQHYCLLRAPFLARIPDHTSYAEATVLPLGLTTAASCLFPPTMLNIPFPNLTRHPNPLHNTSTTAANQRPTLLINGASSSIGISGIQLARLSPSNPLIIATASPHNHDLVLSAGADKVFDHTSPTVVTDIVNHLISTNATVVGCYDAISQPQTIKMLCAVLNEYASHTETLQAKQGGGRERGRVRKFIAAVFPGAEDHAEGGVEVRTNLDEQNGDMRSHGLEGRLWEVIGEAVGKGEVRCLPPKILVRRKGLEGLQEGMRRMGEGVSGGKVVVEF